MIPRNNTNTVDEVSGFRHSMSRYLTLELYGRSFTARGPSELQQRLNMSQLQSRLGPEVEGRHRVVKLN